MGSKVIFLLRDKTIAVGEGRARLQCLAFAVLFLTAPKLGLANCDYTFSPSQVATIPATVASAGSGKTFCFNSGTYRLLRIQPLSGDTFVGTPPGQTTPAELNGSQLMTSFNNVTIGGVSYYYTTAPSSPYDVTSYGCESGYPQCNYNEMLFKDNVLLQSENSLSAVADTTKCFFDYSGAEGNGAAVYFRLASGDVPSNHTFEESYQFSSAAPVAFADTGGATNVTIQGFVIDKYAGSANLAAVGQQSPGNGWVVENNTIEWNHGPGITAGTGSVTQNNHLAYNGIQGATNASSSDGFTMSGNEIDHNNEAGYSLGDVAAGIKFGRAEGNTVVSNNYIHDNFGNGYWNDGCSTGGTVTKNTIVNNQGEGIRHEVSQNWTFSNNIIQGNVQDGIEVNASHNTTIYGNAVFQNGAGIVLTMQGGLTANCYGNALDVNNDLVHGNAVALNLTTEINRLQVSPSISNPGSYATSKGNSYAGDNYCLASSSGAYYGWPYVAGNSSYPTLGQAAWRSVGQDATGTWSCPAVIIITPSAGATISGDVPVTAYAADNATIAKVELYVDGVLAGTVTSANNPFDFTWNSALVSNGTHTLSAKGYDSAGTAGSASVAVTVANLGPSKITGPVKLSGPVVLH